MAVLKPREVGIGEHVRVDIEHGRGLASLALWWLNTESQNVLDAYEEWLVKQGEFSQGERVAFRMWFARLSGHHNMHEREIIAEARAIDRGVIAARCRTAGDWQGDFYESTSFDLGRVTRAHRRGAG